jgi:hypothetical protein
MPVGSITPDTTLTFFLSFVFVIIVIVVFSFVVVFSLVVWFDAASPSSSSSSSIITIVTIIIVIVVVIIIIIISIVIVVIHPSYFFKKKQTIKNENKTSNNQIKLNTSDLPDCMDCIVTIYRTSQRAKPTFGTSVENSHDRRFGAQVVAQRRQSRCCHSFHYNKNNNNHQLINQSIHQSINQSINHFFFQPTKKHTHTQIYYLQLRLFDRMTPKLTDI